jgi:RNA polymerase sigma factor (sigma-70 family)
MTDTPAVAARAAQARAPEKVHAGVDDALFARRLAELDHLPRQISWRHLDGWPAFVSREDIEQLGRETLIKVARKIEPEREHQLGALVTTAIQRDIIDFRRSLYGRNGDRPRLVYDNEEERESLPAPEQPSFETRDAIHQLFSLIKLTDTQQTVLGYMLADWRPVDIARELGVSESRVHHVIRQVRRKCEPYRHLLG